MKAVEPNLQPFKPTGSPKDVIRTGRMMGALKNQWFNKHVAEAVEEKEGNTFHKFFKKDVETGLKPVYLDLLIQIVEHYQPIGVLAESVDMYVTLLAKLKGEKYAEDEFLEDTEAESKEDESKEAKVEEAETKEADRKKSA